MFIGKFFIFGLPNNRLETMLELSKQILQKVSFDRHLFEKELKKAVKWIQKDDLKSFKTWCVVTFGVVYPDVLQQVFEAIH